MMSSCVASILGAISVMPLRLSMLFGLHDFVGLLCQTKRSLPCGFGNNGKLLSLILLYCNRRISLAILTRRTA
jgi:hypothetical protein